MAKQKNIEFGKKLKLLRMNLDAKQSHIAAQLGITQQAYSYLENGKIQFTETIIEKICLVFKINFQDFMLVNNQSQKTKLIPKLNDANFDMYTSQVMIAKLKKQLIEKELQIVQLQIQLKTQQKTTTISAIAKPIYVLI